MNRTAKNDLKRTLNQVRLWLTALMLMLFTPSIAQACKCVDRPSDEKAFNSYENVALVKVCEIHAEPYPSPYKSSEIEFRDRVFATGKVIANIKGTISSPVHIEATPYTSCSVPVTIGDTYLIFMHTEEDIAGLHVCSQNRNINFISSEKIISTLVAKFGSEENLRKARYTQCVNIE